MTQATRIIVAEDLSDLGPADELLDRPTNGFYTSRPWLSVCADISATAQRYFVASADARPITVVPWSLPTGEAINTAYRPQAWYPWREPEPYLLLAQGHGYRTAWAGEPDAGTAGAVFETAVRLAAEQGRPWVYALHLTAATADAIVAGVRADTPVLPTLSALPDCFLPAPGECVEDYLDTVGSRRKVKFNNERKRALGLPGIRFRPARLADEVSALAPLLRHAVARHGSARTEEGLAAELAALSRHAAEHEVLVVVEEDGKPVGFALWYEWNGRLWARNLALDERFRTTATPVLFYLMFRRALEICYERGLDGVHLGPTNLAAKLRRGARLEPLWHISVCHGQEVLRPANARRTIDHVVGMITEDCGPYAPSEDLALMREKAFGYVEAF
ncbi:MAG TPA: GNAT family N-acetyltransferase [Pseudonocardiaceae bacterium]|jgi:hypothetical protein